MFRLCYFLSVFIFLSLFFFNSAWAGSTFDSQDLIIEHKAYKESFKGLDLHKNMKQIGWSLGTGFGSTWWGTNRHHDFIIGEAHYGQIISQDMAQGEWYQGNWEILGEFIGGLQFQPCHRYLFGVLPVLRYNFTILQKAVPFLNIGAGIAYTNIDEPDLSTHYQFNSQAGCGIHYFLRPDFALTCQYRLLHVSNAGIEEPNDGINAHLVLFGFNWFY